MKYIIIEYQGLLPMPILFPDMLTHSEVAAGFPHPSKIRSAGFVSYQEHAREFVCLGRSESLNIESKPDHDSELFNSWFGGGESYLNVIAAIQSNDPEVKKSVIHLPNSNGR